MSRGSRGGATVKIALNAADWAAVQDAAAASGMSPDAFALFALLQAARPGGTALAIRGEEQSLALRQAEREEAVLESNHRLARAMELNAQVAVAANPRSPLAAMMAWDEAQGEVAGTAGKPYRPLFGAPEPAQRRLPSGREEDE